MRFSAQFGCLSWSGCENKLLYVAEKSRQASTDALDEVASSGKVHTRLVIDAVCAVITVSLKIFEELRLHSSIPTTVFSKERISMFEERCYCLPMYCRCVRACILF